MLSIHSHQRSDEGCSWPGKTVWRCQTAHSSCWEPGKSFVVRFWPAAFPRDMNASNLLLHILKICVNAWCNKAFSEPRQGFGSFFTAAQHTCYCSDRCSSLARWQWISLCVGGHWLHPGDVWLSASWVHQVSLQAPWVVWLMEPHLPSQAYSNNTDKILGTVRAPCCCESNKQ